MLPATDKSFLVLFFKKELLASLLLVCRNRLLRGLVLDQQLILKQIEGKLIRRREGRFPSRVAQARETNNAGRLRFALNLVFTQGLRPVEGLLSHFSCALLIARTSRSLAAFSFNSATKSACVSRASLASCRLTTTLSNNGAMTMPQVMVNICNKKSRTQRIGCSGG